MSREEIPAGWCVTPLAKCVDVLDSRRVPVNSEDRAKRPGMVPYYGATGQVGWIDEHLFDEDLLLIGEDGAPFFDKSKPIAYLISGKSWVNNHAHVLRAIGTITTNQYLKYFLDAFSFEGYVNGTTRLKLTQAAMNSIPVLLPPLPEQRRIVAKLEALLAKVDASRKRLERIPVILKRFRQAVLAAACDGRLTEDWRTGHGGIEPSSKVLNGLRTPDPEPFLNTFEDTSIKDLPDTWSWVPLGKLGRTMGGGTPSKENEEFWSGSIPWVSPKDMKRDRIADSQDHISGKALDQSPVNQIPKGSILFVIRGMILNHTLPVAITDSVVTINQDMKALVPEIPEIAEFLFLASKYLAPAILFEVKEATHGTRRIETPLLKNWAVPFPPLPEQQEIVRRVNELFVFADQIEARYAKAKAQVDRLTQSTLAKSFRGELVPQDPNDEPADVLLSRLGAAPTGASAPARRRGRPPRVQSTTPSVAPVALAEDREVPALADLTPKAILQAHREVLTSIPSPLSEDNLLRAVALRLGFRRLGGRIKAKLSETLAEANSNFDR